VQRDYSTQAQIYAMAALRAGASEVEVVHFFLERPDAPVSQVFTEADELDLELTYPVTEQPCRSICSGCPGEGGLCSWPLAMTRREGVDTLF